MSSVMVLFAHRINLLLQTDLIEIESFERLSLFRRRKTLTGALISKQASYDLFYRCISSEVGSKSAILKLGHLKNESQLTLRTLVNQFCTYFRVRPVYLERLHLS